MLHVNIIMLHVDINKWHVYINMLHVDIEACFILHATIIHKYMYSLILIQEPWHQGAINLKIK